MSEERWPMYARWPRFERLVICRSFVHLAIDFIAEKI
jgi:hypothetical protein